MISTARPASPALQEATTIVVFSPDSARLLRGSTPRQPTAVVLVLHGGNVTSSSRVRWFDPAVLRLRPIAATIGRQLPDVAVHRLLFARRGWNGTGAEPLRDTRWALIQLRRLHPGLPIVLVGHSMGARVALQLGGEPAVAGVVALTPWAPADDPVDQLRGVHVEVIQGTADRTCPEPDTRVFLARAESAGARVHRTLLPGLGHAMLGKFWVWHRLTWQSTAAILGQRSTLDPRPADET